MLLFDGYIDGNFGLHVAEILSTKCPSTCRQIQGAACPGYLYVANDVRTCRAEKNEIK